MKNIRYWIISSLFIIESAFAQLPNCTITMSEKDYNTLISRDRFSDEFLSATFTWNDTTWKDVKIRYKGHSKRYFEKKSYRIKFPKKHPFRGVHQINLHAIYNDKSLLREKLAYDLFHRMGTLAPQAEYVNLKINHQSLALYLLVDRIDDDFLKSHELEESSLYNADDLYALADLTEQPDDLLKIYYPKEAGDADDYDDLKELLHEINTTPDSSFESVVNNLFDTTSLYNWLAGNILMMMGDSYNKNYFLYRVPNRKTNQWMVIPWDYDISFGLSGDLALQYPNSILNDGFTYSFPPLSGPENVLKNRMLKNQNMMNRLRLRVETFLQNVFTEEYLSPRIDSLVRMIREAVNNDSQKWGSNQDFLDNVESVKDFITCRRNYLQKTFINPASGTNNIVSLPISELNKPYHFVDVDGRTIATMWFMEIDGLDSVTIIAHADMMPPIVKATDTAKCVKRWLEVVPFPAKAKFIAKLQWIYRDVSSTDREVGKNVNDERMLQPYYYDGQSLVRFNSQINPFGNCVTINSIYEQQCGYGKYFLLKLP